MTSLLVCAALAGVLVGSSGCAGRRAAETAPTPAANRAPAPGCVGCATLPMPPELALAIEARVAELKARGGVCEEYGVVLENALASGHITIRPYMWRVQGNLASAEGESSGEMTIARDIDSLNVGARALDDVLRSAEHEAAHIALRIASGDPVREGWVDDRVNSCRSTVRSERR
ncbi:MAG: hypothetical protein ACREN6_02860 [Gemmatimonadaceae bacterium]